MEQKKTDAIVIGRLDVEATYGTSKVNGFSRFGSCTVIN